MADLLPLLMFPKAVVKIPQKAKPRSFSKMKLPGFAVQAARLDAQFDGIGESDLKLSATLSDAVSGLEPEAVLVLEVLGSVGDFQAALEAAGLDWVGEIEVDDAEPVDGFFWLDEDGNLDKPLVARRLFLSVSNQSGLNKVLSLWKAYKAGEPKFAHGFAKWRKVFDQLYSIRRWGIQETLIETSMLDNWRNLVDPVNPADDISFQIELFYRKTPELRRATEKAIEALLSALGGRLIGGPIDIYEIAFHAVKATVPGTVIAELIQHIEAKDLTDRLGLFFFSGVMYFRPTGQSYFTVDDNVSPELVDFADGVVTNHPPVAAIFDGAPLVNHESLRNRVLLDDVFDVVRLYGAGERRHGTSMASLVVRGDLNDSSALPLDAPVYFVPIMQPDANSANGRRRNEHVPDSVFLEDRIHIAVRQLFEGRDGIAPAAPTVKIINLSIGDLNRPFLHMASPLARLLDWLSWRYRVLFCVSAGNFSEGLTLDAPHPTFATQTDSAKTASVIKSVAGSLSQRRLLSPAESINSITVASVHSDYSPLPPQSDTRIDVTPFEGIFSPSNRLGSGFRNSVKPEILMPGGKQLYQTPLRSQDKTYKFDPSVSSPGMKVATDGGVDALKATTYSRGTSNANALATRSAVRIEQMLGQLASGEETAIPDSLTTVMLKALLVHGAKQKESVQDLLSTTLKTPLNSRKFKALTSRFLGYGESNVERVLSCDGHRATAIACAEINENEINEYSFPIPAGLANTKAWRRLTITLAWLTPINPNHRNLREAKLEFGDGGASWTEGVLNLTNEDADLNQVTRGTVQHEVRAGDREIKGYVQGDTIRIHVICKKDATNRLDEQIPYGLAVTLEVKADVQLRIYEQVKAGLEVQIKSRVAV
jgi:Subtilase family